MKLEIHEFLHVLAYSKKFPVLFNQSKTFPTIEPKTEFCILIVWVGQSSPEIQSFVDQSNHSDFLGIYSHGFCCLEPFLLFPSSVHSHALVDLLWVALFGKIFAQTSVYIKSFLSWFPRTSSQPTSIWPQAIQKDSNFSWWATGMNIMVKPDGRSISPTWMSISSQFGWLDSSSLMLLVEIIFHKYVAIVSHL